ncbi:hypothetical protein TVAG_161760 [Trichomonas vaginalis G3]|uniref:UBR-type domain-containing protein n=1 Tax=Trichomonas vaginalis (strain ATCC PRA-98 / G3) TaxID=412133 RepID=A2EUP9_TRIV3|nr:E3 ubiquitin-protein ligase family [Trichomonas vaginalis G3]EAY03637.1 hypothetical protein TVAG_161760 [Trichomonas vaginalis G3]KAI5524732.1 E3 ubiquitin-protein ligase family [Trichomonas vaginalis G3]|eukprot:XP_001315860.1 hypothetical protein [Trichomonas vaginalis G3]
MLNDGLQLSHHSTETTSCVLALCNTEFSDNCFLGVGSNLGGIDLVNLETRELLASYTEVHENNVMGIDFMSPFVLLSYDKSKLVKTDTVTSGRRTLFEPLETIYSGTISLHATNTIISSESGIYLIDDRTEPTKLNNSIDITELAFSYDNTTLFTSQYGQLGCLDIRKPEHIQTCKLPVGVSSMACNENHLAIISKDSILYTFDLPLNPLSFREHIPILNTLPARPTFYNGLVVAADGCGSIFVVDPNSQDENYSLSVELATPAVSVAANSSCIAVSLEDDIYVYSHFDFEPNLVRAQFVNETEEEEEAHEAWLTQVDTIKAEEGDCTYEKYGYCDQLVYVCRDCIKSDKPFGICEQCAKICHQGHDVRPIGVRRRFRCDCGNDRSHRPCSAMMKAKTCENPHNSYGHNFFDRWCTCDGPDTGGMVQCIVCSDWFHVPCIGLFPRDCPIKLDDVDCLDDWTFVCKKCLETRVTFLEKFPDHDPPDLFIDFVHESSVEHQFQHRNKDNYHGIGFTIFGGRWMPPNSLLSFKNEPEIIKEFSPLDTTEEDKNLPKASGQDEYVNAMRELYSNVFERAMHSGRTVAQASDVHAAVNKSVSDMFHRRFHDQEDM